MPPKRKTQSETSTQKKKSMLSQSKKVATSNEQSAIAGDIPQMVLSDYLKESGWRNNMKQEFDKDYFKRLQNNINDLLRKKVAIFPPRDLIFAAFNITPFEDVKVVILGQDPYHDDGQAQGLSFSVPVGVPVPRSLQNIYKELSTDIPGFKAPDHGCLEKWAQQGVLLLNATLTVEAHEPNSHGGKKFGWQTFTDHAIRTISDQLSGVVFILWGNFAHKKGELVDEKKHCVIKSAHPSPLSFNKFAGSKCFSKTNTALKKFGKSEIDWTL